MLPASFANTASLMRHPMKRRRFTYWLGAGLFGLGETLRIEAFDRLAAATMNFNRRATGSRSSSPAGSYGASGKAINYGQKPAAQQNFSYNTFPQVPVVDDDVDDPTNHGKTDPKRLARQGRPPSRWLRSLEAEELREWLKTVTPPETGVSGMTVWTHLTRDHLFDAEKIEGLKEIELAKLHSAAHAGY